MGSDVSGESFKFQREVDHLRDFGITVVRFSQVVAGVQRLLQVDAQLVGNHAGDLVDASQRDAKRTADVLDRRFGFHGSEGPDLRDAVFAVFFFHVANDVDASIFTKVDIDIGGFCTIFIQKSFEQQIVFQRANVT